MGDWRWAQNVCLMFVSFLLLFSHFFNFIGGLAVLGWDGVGDLL